MMPTSSFENINEFAQTDLALASMPVAAFRADLQGFIRYANGAAENLFDLTFEDLNAALSAALSRIRANK